MKSQYVISIKRTTGYLNNNPLKEEDQFFEYICIDNYGCPYFSNIQNACMFDSEDDVVKFLNENSYFKNYIENRRDDYNILSLAIRKIIFKKITDIELQGVNKNGIQY